jgi:hypothetical protein
MQIFKVAVANLFNLLVSKFIAHPNIHHNVPFMKRLYAFCDAWELELYCLVFFQEGIQLCWKVEDIVKYVIEIKHHQRSSGKIIM